MKKITLFLFALGAVGLILQIGCESAPQGPYQAMGIKIGEVTDHSAIVWTRLTRHPERVGKEGGLPTVQYQNPETGEIVPRQGRQDFVPLVSFPESKTIDTIEGAVPGMTGQVRVRYKSEAASDWQETSWQAVDPEADFARQFPLSDLQAGTRYLVQVQSRPEGKSRISAVTQGRFRTAPDADQPARVLFMVSTGQAYPDQDAPGGGYKIYPAMLKLDPDFFVHTGDIVYYDQLAKTLPLARWHWARMYSLPTNVLFHNQVASYFIKDDHDTWMNDCWPGMQTRFMGDFTFEQGQKVFLDEVPMGERTWRTYRWGADLQIWLVEGRDFRSPNDMPDGPEKTIWGQAQKEWFKRTVQASDAAFRVLISPTPLVGPDRERKHDNHSNKDFKTEGDELRRFISQQNNMVVACGDRHWQYVSVDPATGLREYSCGPASNEHAGGWAPDDKRPEHLYLNVVGGFLAMEVTRVDGQPTLFARHYSVDGELLNEDRQIAR